MKRLVYFGYGLAAYAVFLGLFLYLGGFVNAFFVPKSLNSGEAGSPAVAIAVNLGLILVFGLQHSVMARPTFKAWWTKVVPQPIERTTYVASSNVALGALLWFWQPLPGVLYSVSNPVGQWALWGLCAAGASMIVATSFVIDHFDLFGLRHVWFHLRGKKYTAPEFKDSLAYRVVRHPLMVGWLLMFWATPHMTVGHLLFSASMSGYILIALKFEERNLVDAFGDTYRAYQKDVPMLIPGLRRKRRTARTETLDRPATVS